MHALPLLIAFTAAAALAPALLRALETSKHVRPNHRGRMLPFPLGALTLAAALVALVPLALVKRLGSGEGFHAEAGLISIYALGVLPLGLLDDILGTRPGEPARRGTRGPGAAAGRGRRAT